MPKIKIKYQRSRIITETAEVEIDVDENAAQQLQSKSTMEAWALHSAALKITEWNVDNSSGVVSTLYRAYIDGKDAGGTME